MASKEKASKKCPCGGGLNVAGMCVVPGCVRQAAVTMGCACFGTSFRVHSILSCPALLRANRERDELAAAEAFLARSV